MRMSRGRISVGAPSREILAAQQAAQRVAAQVPDAIISERVPEASLAAVHASPISESKSFDTEPEMSDAAIEEREQFDRTEQSVIAPPAVEDGSTPQRPEFKEPPPEFDEPPRPTFKEPPPEVDDVPSPGMQPTSFVSPPASPPPVMDEKPLSVTPATPNNPIKALRRNSALRSGSASPARSPSPLTSSATPAIPAEDQVLSVGRTGLSRHSSGQAAVVRGPRISRGPRPAAGGGNVSSMVANLNRSSMSKSPPPSPNYKRLSGGTTRPGSMLGAADGKSKIGRSSAFSRRTMASDAEDEVVDR
jgi:hypothetical protein